MKIDSYSGRQSLDIGLGDIVEVYHLSGPNCGKEICRPIGGFVIKLTATDITIDHGDNIVRTYSRSLANNNGQIISLIDQSIGKNAIACPNATPPDPKLLVEETRIPRPRQS